MELQFEKSTLACLAPVTCEVKTAEQTQEVRLPDMMPDIGKVLACWGQVLLRGKQWRGGSMGVSGGVMVWVLYEPEDDPQPQSVETWVPFQMSWDLPETQRDGYMNVRCLLRCADARTLSSRKLMVRVGISAMGQAMEPVQAEFYAPGEVPEDVQLLKQSYPVKLPREAGEKTFQLDEELSAPEMDKIIRYEVLPQVTDQKVMAGKVVFRGALGIHALYMDTQGQLKNWDTEVPFSQFSDLEQEYDDTAEAEIMPAVTNLELDLQENGNLRLKAGLTGQYIVYDRPMIEVVEDAYSLIRPVAAKTETLDVPMVLDQRHEVMRLEQTLPGGGQVLDVFQTMEHPTVHHGVDEVELEVPGTFQVLRYNADGTLQSEHLRTQSTWKLPSDENSRTFGAAQQTGWPEAMGSTVRGNAAVSVSALAGQGIPMVTGLTLGEQTEPDPSRPSLILRRAGQEPLWDLAKMSGSTVDAIRQANKLSGEPEQGKMLLIPVL